MEHDLVVEARVVLKDSIIEAQVGISDGTIAEVRKQGLRGSRMIRANERLLFPGFIDSHVHLREPGWEYKEGFRTGSMAAAHGGVTTMFDMPNNPIPTTNLPALKQKIALASSESMIDVKFFAGVDGKNSTDIPVLGQHAIGFKGYLAKSTGGLTLPVEDLRQVLAEVAQTGRPISLHCEDQRIIDEREKILSGSKAPDVYSDIRPPESEIESVRMVLELAESVNGVRVNICHVSTSEALVLARGSSISSHRVHTEVALHHLFFNRKAMFANGLLRTNPPLRDESERRSLIEELGRGNIDAVVTDHAPHTLSEKESEGLAGVPGLDDYGHVVTWLIKEAGIDPLVIARTCSSDPALFCGLTDRGEIAAQKKADLTVIDLKAPERVTADSLMTKCGWSPYEGTTFPGRVAWTIKGGEVLYDLDGIIRN